jgi:Tol biopolymer transport system component
MESDGSGVTSLFASSGIANITEPSFNPSGSQIAFVVTWNNGSSSLLEVTVYGNELKQLAQSNGEIGTFCWSPNGRMIAFDEYQDRGWTIWLVDSSDSGSESILLSQNITQGRNFDYRDPSWGPNSTWIVLSSNLSGQYNIWSYNLISRKLAQLTTGGNDSKPSVSPSGAFIAYSSYLESDSEWTLWITDANGSDSHMAVSYPQDQNPGTSWTPVISPSSCPVWNPSSNGVLFFSNQAGGNVANVFVYYIGVNVSVYIHIGGKTEQLSGDSLVPLIFGRGDIDPSWGNGGLSIAYCELGNGGQYHIWIRTLATAVPKPSYG